MVPYGQDHVSDTRLFPVLIFKFSFFKPQLWQSQSCVIY